MSKWQGALVATLGALVATSCSIPVSGPDRVISLGKVRPISCKYAGDFLGGTGYDCVVRNMGGDPREITPECVNFDSAGRMIGNSDWVTELWRKTLAPGEERVIRYYFSRDANLSVCADLEGYASMFAQIQKDQAEWRKNDMWSELKLR